MGTAMPTLVAFVLPAIDACGSGGEIIDASSDGTLQDGKKTDSATDGFAFPDSSPTDAPQNTDAPPCNECTFTVPVPEAGVFPDLASVCAATPPVQSNTAATITLSNWDENAHTADGFIAITSDLLAALISDPVVSGGGVTIQQLTKTINGYTFKASQLFNQSLVLKVTLQVACGDGGLDAGVQTVESTTDLALCGVTFPRTWESSGSTCIQCCVVCEMAPTPITSDNTGDDLPLARALRLRVIELARAGNKVVLFAQNDAGGDAEYEWRVSGGSVERLSDDVIVWTLPEVEHAQPFGQLALWNVEGAIVENFYWGAA
jgi:hypothetical protein